MKVDLRRCGQKGVGVEFMTVGHSFDGIRYLREKFGKRLCSLIIILSTLIIVTVTEF